MEAFIIPTLLIDLWFCVFQVCDWLYPLTAETPVLLANSGIFMFPDSLADTPGSYVGIVLSSELPAAYRDMFVDILSQLAELRIQVRLYSQYGAYVRMGVDGAQQNAFYVWRECLLVENIHDALLLKGKTHDVCHFYPKEHSCRYKKVPA